MKRFLSLLLTLSLLIGLVGTTTAATAESADALLKDGAPAITTGVNEDGKATVKVGGDKQIVGVSGYLFIPDSSYYDGRRQVGYVDFSNTDENGNQLDAYTETDRYTYSSFEGEPEVYVGVSVSGDNRDEHYEYNPAGAVIEASVSVDENTYYENGYTTKFSISKSSSEEYDDDGTVTRASTNVSTDEYAEDGTWRINQYDYSWKGYTDGQLTHTENSGNKTTYDENGNKTSYVEENLSLTYSNGQKSYETQSKESTEYVDGSESSFKSEDRTTIYDNGKEYSTQKNSSEKEYITKDMDLLDAEGTKYDTTSVRSGEKSKTTSESYSYGSKTRSRENSSEIVYAIIPQKDLEGNIIFYYSGYEAQNRTEQVTTNYADGKETSSEKYVTEEINEYTTSDLKNPEGEVIGYSSPETTKTTNTIKREQYNNGKLSNIEKRDTVTEYTPVTTYTDGEHQSVYTRYVQSKDTEKGYEDSYNEDGTKTESTELEKIRTYEAKTYKISNGSMTTNSYRTGETEKSTTSNYDQFGTLTSKTISDDSTAYEIMEIKDDEGKLIDYQSVPTGTTENSQTENYKADGKTISGYSETKSVFNIEIYKDEGSIWYSTRQKDSISDTTRYNAKKEVIGTDHFEGNYDDGDLKKETATIQDKINGNVVRDNSYVRDIERADGKTVETSTTAEKIYHQLTGNLLSDNTEKTTKTRVDDEKNNTSETVTEATNITKRDNNLASEETSSSKSFTDYKDSSKNTYSYTSSRKDYNSYSGKFISETKTVEEREGRRVPFSGMQSYYPKYKSTTITTDADGKVIYTSTTETKKTAETKNGVTTTVYSYSNDYQNGDSEPVSVRKETVNVETGKRVNKYNAPDGSYQVAVTSEYKATTYTGDRLTESETRSSTPRIYDESTDTFSDSVETRETLRYDSKTGNQTYAYKNGTTTKYNKDGNTAGSESSYEYKYFNSETGKQTSGSKSVRTQEYDQNNNLTVSTDTYTNYGFEGKVTSSRTTTENYTYDPNGNQTKSVIATDNEQYDSQTFGLVQKTHEEETNDDAKQLYTSKTEVYNGDNKLISVTESTDDSAYAYNAESEEAATTRTTTRTEKSAKYDPEGETDKPYVTSERKESKVYKKTEDGLWDENNYEEFAEETYEDWTGKVIRSEKTVHSFKADAETDDSETSEVTSLTETAYDTAGAVKTREEAENTSTFSSTLKENENGYVRVEKTVNAGSGKVYDKDGKQLSEHSREDSKTETMSTEMKEDVLYRTERVETLSANKDSKSHRETITKGETVINSKNEFITDYTSTSETTVNGTKTASDKTTQVNSITQADNPVEGDKRVDSNVSETEHFVLGEGTTKTKTVESTSYVWGKSGADDNETLRWIDTGTEHSTETYLDDALIASSKTAESTKTTYAEDKKSRTRVETVVNTDVDEEGKKTEKTIVTTVNEEQKDYGWDTVKRTEETNGQLTASWETKTEEKSDVSAKTSSNETTTQEERYDEESGKKTYDSVRKEGIAADGNTQKRTETSGDATNEYNAVTGNITYAHTDDSEEVYQQIDFGDAGMEEKLVSQKYTGSDANYWKENKTHEFSYADNTAYDYEAGKKNYTYESAEKDYNKLTGKLKYETESTRTEVSDAWKDDHAENSITNPTWQTTSVNVETTTKSYDKDGLTGTTEETQYSSYNYDQKVAGEKFTEVSSEYNSKTGEKEASSTSETDKNYAMSQYSHEWLLTDAQTVQERYEDDKLSYASTEKTVNTYTDDARTANYTAEFKHYDDQTGALQTTEKTESTGVTERTITADGEDWGRELKDESKTTVTNKDNTVIYAKSTASEEKESEDKSRSWTENTESEEYFDYLGNRTSGYSSSYTWDPEKKQGISKTENYNSYGLSSSSESITDEKGRTVTANNKSYSSYKGQSVLSYEYTSAPEYKQFWGPNGPTSTLNHTVTSRYDVYGGLTEKTTVDEDRIDTTGETTRTTVTKKYVGDSEDELARTTVFEYISGRNAASGNYINDTTVYNWEGKIISRDVTSNEKDPITGKEVYTSTSIREDENLNSETIRERGTDENGYAYEKTTNTNGGKLTSTYERSFDEAANRYVSTRESYDKGELTGKTVELEEAYDEAGRVVTATEYYDAKGQKILSKLSTIGLDQKIAVSYQDGTGKEIGFEKTDDQGNYTSKVPSIYGYELDGSWTEESRDKKGEKTSVKNYGPKGALEFSNVYENKVRTETWYNNPDDVISYQRVTKDAEKDEKGAVLGRESVETYFGLNGKQDRKVVNTTKYEYDEYDGAAKTTRVTEYRNSEDKAVVTKTVVSDRDDWTKNSTTWVNAAGETIGYERVSEEGDLQESLVPDFNEFTGYVSGTRKEVTRHNADGTTDYTRETTRHGELTEEMSSITQADGSYTNTEHRYGNENNQHYLAYESIEEYDAKQLTGKMDEMNFRSTGTLAYSASHTRAYDKEKDLWVLTEEHLNNKGKLVYTRETTENILHENQDDVVTIQTVSYKDAAGNEIGYETVDAKGNTSSKVPGYNTWNGELDGSWTEETYDKATNTSTSKYYDEKGMLTSESRSDYTTSSTTNYWEGKDVPSHTINRVTDETGMTTTTVKDYNEDGSERRSYVTVAGRKTGTHLGTDTTFYYNNAGELVYTHEYVYDQLKEERTTVYKDASGKQIGYRDLENKEEGTISTLEPTGRTVRTGEYTGFSEDIYKTDGSGSISRDYDANMKLRSWSEAGYNDADEWTNKFYNLDHTTPHRVLIDRKSGFEDEIYYRNNGTAVSRTESLYAHDASTMANTDISAIHKYYNDKDELVYTALRMRNAGNDNSYMVYLDAKGNEIGRDETYDNGDTYQKTPNTSYTNTITGYWGYETKDNGNQRTERSYNADGTLRAEVTYTDEFINGDEVTTSITRKNGAVLNTTYTFLDKDGKEIKEDTIEYDDLGNSSETKRYFEDDYENIKQYDENGNVTYYGSTWNDNDWVYNSNTWANGVTREYSWYDDHNEQGSLYERYNPDGSWYLWSYDQTFGHGYDDGTSSSESWYYGTDGILDSIAVTKDGVTNTTYYNKDGSIKGYDWGRTSVEDYWRIEAYESEIWDANKLLYKLHTENAPDVYGTIETWTDPNGNVKTIKRNHDSGDSTASVKLTDTTDGWKQAFGNEWYYVENGQVATGWKFIGGTWYFFEKDGAMGTGIVNDNGTYYTMADSGAWQTGGWSYAEDMWTYTNPAGVNLTGWQLIDGVWYYFNDGWYIDTGVYGTDRNWKQGGTVGEMETGAVHIWDPDWSDKTVYFFNENGSWDTSAGWKRDGVDYYYFFEGGTRATGWQQIDGVWYYFNEKGVMRNGWVGWFYLNENGSLPMNTWFQDRYEDGWYYADENGQAVSGWKNIGGVWYYMDPGTGIMAEDEVITDGHAMYYMSESGAMASDQWVEDEDNWYYAGSNGQLATGWQLINGTWYYMHDDGVMATDEWIKSGDAYYYVDESGAEATGWVQDGGLWYYLNADGTMHTGWLDLGGTWYYMAGSGAMVTGDVEIDGVMNHFNGSGVWLGAD